jgi:ferritin-like metal-binding protein YciE
MKILQDLFLDELADMYDAEHRLAKALPKMMEAANHDELRAAFNRHLEETEEQVGKLEQVFEMFGRSARPKKCEAVVGLVKEAEEIAAENEGEPTIDAALISAAQKLEHYEIASYGCLREWAEQLGNNRAAQFLREILDEEKAADAMLTELARQCCNESAEAKDEPAEPGGSRRSVRPGAARVRADDENN